MTRWLITGGGGQVATRLAIALGHDATVAPRRELDIVSPTSIGAAIERARPDVIINTAAYTAVDAAETDEENAYAVNATAVAHLARAAQKAGARLVHLSTDYVFAGNDPGRPYTTTDAVAPATAYGRTKLAGELAALEYGATVVRTAWVYGGPSANFVDTMLRLADDRERFTVVADQTGSPTYAGDLAAALIALGTRDDVPSLLHYTNDGTATWYDLGQETFRVAGLDPDRIQPIATSDYPRPAPRPAWSVLSHDTWLGAGLPAPRHWRDALRAYLQDSGRAVADPPH